MKYPGPSENGKRRLADGTKKCSRNEIETDKKENHDTCSYHRRNRLFCVRPDGSYNIGYAFNSPSYNVFLYSGAFARLSRLLINIRWIRGNRDLGVSQARIKNSALPGLTPVIARIGSSHIDGVFPQN